jgi:hypothetical protein
MIDYPILSDVLLATHNVLLATHNAFKEAKYK